jgi:hypothetical protein
MSEEKKIAEEVNGVKGEIGCITITMILIWLSFAIWVLPVLQSIAASLATLAGAGG